MLSVHLAIVINTRVYRPHGHEDKCEYKQHFGLKEIDFLNGEYIVRVVIEAGYSIGFRSHGVAYYCGYNNAGELGIGGSKHEVNIPTDSCYLLFVVLYYHHETISIMCTHMI